MDGGRDDEVAGRRYSNIDPLYNLKIIFTVPKRCVTSHPGAAGLTCCHQDAALGVHDPLAQRLRGEACKLNMRKREAERRSCCSTYDLLIVILTSLSNISVGYNNIVLIKVFAETWEHNNICVLAKQANLFTLFEGETKSEGIRMLVIIPDYTSNV